MRITNSDNITDSIRKSQFQEQEGDRIVIGNWFFDPECEIDGSNMPYFRFDVTNIKTLTQKTFRCPFSKMMRYIEPAMMNVIVTYNDMIRNKLFSKTRSEPQYALLHIYFERLLKQSLFEYIKNSFNFSELKGFQDMNDCLIGNIQVMDDGIDLLSYHYEIDVFQ